VTKYVLFGAAIASLGGSLALSAVHGSLAATASGTLAGLSLLLAYLSGLKTGYDAD
jgi:hypothetical protein